ncbi:MAG: hypothetical protein AAGE61_03385 [Pseudomonadota bacterium]
MHFVYCFYDLRSSVIVPCKPEASPDTSLSLLTSYGVSPFAGFLQSSDTSVNLIATTDVEDLVINVLRETVAAVTLPR